MGITIMIKTKIVIQQIITQQLYTIYSSSLLDSSGRKEQLQESLLQETAKKDHNCEQKNKFFVIELRKIEEERNYFLLGQDMSETEVPGLEYHFLPFFPHKTIV
jgi:hypothetical protein